MKTIQQIKYLLTIYAILSVAGISCKKELDKDPLDKFANDAFWTSESNAILALNGVYRGTVFTNAAEYTPSDWWDYNGLNWLELATDNAYPRTGDSAPTNKLTNGTLTSNVAILGNYWTNSYCVLHAVMISLKTLEKFRWMKRIRNV
jgi:hypothetical protein